MFQILDWNPSWYSASTLASWCDTTSFQNISVKELPADGLDTDWGEKKTLYVLELQVYDTNKCVYLMDDILATFQTTVFWFLRLRQQLFPCTDDKNIGKFPINPGQWFFG